jgi:hypothetical protein
MEPTGGFANMGIAGGYWDLRCGPRGSRETGFIWGGSWRRKSTGQIESLTKLALSINSKVALWSNFLN